MSGTYHLCMSLNKPDTIIDIFFYEVTHYVLVVLKPTNSIKSLLLDYVDFLQT